jgi:hypothetical protein
VDIRVAEIDNGAKLTFHWNYCYRSRRESEGLGLMERGYLIIGQIKNSGRAGQVEALRANRSSLTQRVGSENQAHGTKESVPAGPRRELQNGRIQRPIPEHRRSFAWPS